MLVHVRKATWSAAVVPLHGLRWGRGPIRRDDDGVRDRLDSRLSRSGLFFLFFWDLLKLLYRRWVLPFLGCDGDGEQNSASVVLA